MKQKKIIPSYIQGHIQPGMAVLVINKDGTSFIDQGNDTQFTYATLSSLDALASTFDFIIIGPEIVQIADMQRLFNELKLLCTPSTRVIIESYSPWVRWFRWGKNKCAWFARADINQLLHITGYSIVTFNPRVIVPIYIPVVSWLINRILEQIPVVNWLCNRQVIIARLPFITKNASVSIIIPVRNEAGNIRPSIEHIPSMGSAMELIYVEGNSQDDTQEEIKRAIADHPDKDITLVIQSAKGKANAVREGFAIAKYDIVMILDGDLTVQPRDLPLFYQAITIGSGEVINGARLLYPMERGAMMGLAYIANYCFARGFSWVTRQRMTDTLCGTKVLWRKDYQRIAEVRGFLGLDDPFGDFDLLFGAAWLYLKIVDVPVRYKARSYGKTNIRHFKDVWVLLWICLKAARRFFLV